MLIKGLKKNEATENYLVIAKRTSKGFILTFAQKPINSFIKKAIYPLDATYPLTAGRYILFYLILQGIRGKLRVFLILY